jgi:hypothetical protein
MLSLAEKEDEVNELAAQLEQEEPSKLSSIRNDHSRSEGQQNIESLTNRVSGTAFNGLTLEYECFLQKAAEKQVFSLRMKDFLAG